MAPAESRRARTIAAAWDSGHNNFNLLRLVAAWLVIYGHAWAITGTPGTDLVGRLTGIKFAGALAVDVFFVISGFLIAASLQRNRWRGYLASRALRLLPGLWACLLLTVLVLGPLLSQAPDYWRQPQVWHYLLANGALWTNAYQLPGVFQELPDSTVNGSLWTLPLEARLYLLLMLAAPLGVLSARRYTLPWLLALVGAFAGIRLFGPVSDYVIRYVWCTAFFITGTALWLNRDRVRLSWPVLGALLAAASLARATDWFAIPYFASVAYGTLCLAFAPGWPRIRHHDLSYGVYLYGWPAAQLVQQVSPGGPLHNTALATPLALALAAASWFLVERPALALKARFGTRTPRAAPGPDLAPAVPPAARRSRS